MAGGDVRVVIRKSKRELLLLDGDRVVRRCRIALGGNPVDDKRREGDSCTPEGEFYVCTRNERSRFHLFLGLSYPDPPHADSALRDGRIARGDHEAILRAHRNKTTPPWKTPMGGEVGIHGGGACRDWTAGCIAVSNEDIEALWASLPLGSRVTIEP